MNRKISLLFSALAVSASVYALKDVAASDEHNLIISSGSSASLERSEKEILAQSGIWFCECEPTHSEASQNSPTSENAPKRRAIEPAMR